MFDWGISLAFLAVIAGAGHVVLGSDHYLPLIAASGAHHWPFRKTFLVTLGCGLGHVAAACLIVGLGLGVWDFYRNSLAAWILIVTGILYVLFGLRKTFQSRNRDAIFIDEKNNGRIRWILFLVFVLGPCEPLIPLMMHPAVMSQPRAVILTAGIFSLGTILTMLALVMGGCFGWNRFGLKMEGRFGYAAAGVLMIFSGAAVLFGGL